MASLRIEKVNELLSQVVSELLVKEISLKAGVFATVVKADTSPDLRQSKIFLSVFPASEGDYVVKTIEKELYSLQGAMNRKLHMRPLPRLRFALDNTEEEAQKVEDILRTF